jgi:flagellar FliL protein
MATTPADASDGKTVKPAKAKGGGVGTTLLLIVAAALGAAAGGFGAVVAAGSLGLGSAKPHSEAASASPTAAVEYIEIDQAFTSNLADTGRYLQVRLSVSQSGGAVIAAAITRHKPALISAVLGVLGEAGEADVATREAKDRLRLRLKQVINETLKANGVAAGIDDVFFTSLVVQ